VAGVGRSDDPAYWVMTSGTTGQSKAVEHRHDNVCIVMHRGCIGGDCVAEHVGLELRNVAANYPFERAQDLRGSSRILATETIRV
jgi:acyl-CoA synthetase (AMP-forming)/AMP-acid ligase II